MKHITLSCQATIIATSILFSFLFPQSAYSDSSINAQYQSLNTRVVFVVQVGSPAPPSLIISHNHPHNKLMHASPTPTKINQKAGISKWLLKNVEPGVYPFSLSFKNHAEVKSLRLTIKYRDPVSGEMQEKLIRP